MVTKKLGKHAIQNTMVQYVPNFNIFRCKYHVANRVNLVDCGFKLQCQNQMMYILCQMEDFEVCCQIKICECFFVIRASKHPKIRESGKQI